MPRPPTDTVQISARVPAAWLDHFDAIARKLSRAGLEVTRTDAYRIAIARGLEELRTELVLSFSLSTEDPEPARDTTPAAVASRGSRPAKARTKRLPVIPRVPTFRIVDVSTGEDLGEVEAPGGTYEDAIRLFLNRSSAEGRDLVAARISGRPGMNPRAMLPRDAVVLRMPSGELVHTAAEVAARVLADRPAKTRGVDN